MCNLYRQDVSQSKISSFLEPSRLRLSEQVRGRNVEAGYVGADQDGPVLVNAGDGQLDLVTKRWGFPAIRDGAKPITNIRNLDNSWWKGANGEYIREAEYRCLLPFAAFAEWNRAESGNAWIEFKSDAPMFAGVWRPWNGERLTEVVGKKRRQRQVHDWNLYAFLTTEPNAVVAPIHPKAMPVIVTTREECERWMGGGEESLELQKAASRRYGCTRLSERYRAARLVASLRSSRMLPLALRLSVSRRFARHSTRNTRPAFLLQKATSHTSPPVHSFIRRSAGSGHSGVGV